MHSMQRSTHDLFEHRVRTITIIVTTTETVSHTSTFRAQRCDKLTERAVA